MHAQRDASDRGVSPAARAGRLMVALLAAASPCWVFGCAPTTYQDGASGVTARISPRTSWRVLGDLRNAEACIDDNLGTAAVSADAYQGARLTIDLGKPCLFNMVVIEHGSAEMGFCREIALATSLDAEHFQPQHVGPGTRRATILAPITPILARFVRIEAVTPGSQPWSIAEIHLR